MFRHVGLLTILRHVRLASHTHVSHSLLLRPPCVSHLASHSSCATMHCTAPVLCHACFTSHPLCVMPIFCLARLASYPTLVNVANVLRHAHLLSHSACVTSVIDALLLRHAQLTSSPSYVIPILRHTHVSSRLYHTSQLVVS